MITRFLEAAILFGILLILPANCQKTGQNSWKEVLKSHLETYPESQPQDLYKFVYQGIMGPNHLNTSKEKMQNYLQYEFQKISADTNMPLTEKISPHNRYIRINLKHFKAINGDIEKLSIILYQSCQPESREDLVAALEQITDLISTGKVAYDKTLWNDYLKLIKEKNYFTPHHSKQYVDHYKPAYRVVSKTLWEENYP